ncbi:MAG: putative kinase [Methanomassiliicoccales archaeon PtaU1.Bin124]|nr:MAG: putative kinase [Methanomassiliicoccales archaeon PtaU1.Bin124]
MRIALTGTPGTGKSSVGALLARKGLEVIEVSDIARSEGLLGELDEERGSFDVDVDHLRDAVDRGNYPDDTIFIGHLAHFLNVDRVIVLRCRPSILMQRLRERGWREEKVRENAEAEALDVILMDCLEDQLDVFEVDASSMPLEDVAKAVVDIIRGKTDKYRPGNTDWSEEVLSWY